MPTSPAIAASRRRLLEGVVFMGGTEVAEWWSARRLESPSTQARHCGQYVRRRATRWRRPLGHFPWSLDGYAPPTTFEGGPPALSVVAPAPTTGAAAHAFLTGSLARL